MKMVPQSTRYLVEVDGVDRPPEAVRSETFHRPRGFLMRELLVVAANNIADNELSLQ